MWSPGGVRGTWHGEHGSLDMFLHFAIPIDVIRHGFGKGQEPCLIRDAEISVNCLRILVCEALRWFASVDRQTPCQW